MSENQTENLKNLFALMQERPELPILPMVHDKIALNNDYGEYWPGKLGKCFIDKYLIFEKYDVIFYKDVDFKDLNTLYEFKSMFFHFADDIDEKMPNEQKLQLMKEEIDALWWEEAIIVYIDPPEST